MSDQPAVTSRKCQSCRGHCSDSERLYETSRDILLLDRSVEPGTFIASLIRERFKLRFVLFDGHSATTYASGESPPDIEERTRGAYFRNSDSFDSDLNACFCVLRLGVRPFGGLALCGGEMTPLMATSLASLTAIALERARSLEQEFRAEAAHRSEELRTAVLDALAHNFKTPLTTIRAASSGLLAAGGLSEIQNELITLIDDQSQKLDDLSSKLLGTAKLDSPDFRPKRESVILSEVVNLTIQKIDDQDRSRFQIVASVPQLAVLGDRKLIGTALTQLFDNAIKYSLPGSAIDIELTETQSEVMLAVRSHEATIPAADREQIFERFHRGSATQHGPAGTGLGLSIVKRIADVHGGRVSVESQNDSGTVFTLVLPKSDRGT